MTASRATNLALVSTTSVTGTYKDLADFNLAVQDIQGVLAGRSSRYDTAPRPGRVDTQLLSAAPIVEPRQITILGTVKSTSAAALASDLRALAGWWSRAVALKTFFDANSFLQLNEVGAEVDVVGMGRRTAKVTLTATALDPRWHSTTLTATAFTTNTQIALGEAPSYPIIRVTGAVTSPVVTLKNAAGTTLGTLSFTGLTIAGGDYVEIDCGAMTVVKSVSSVISDASAALDVGSRFPMVLDPADADVLTPTWPSLSTSGGTATCTYRKCWF